MHGREHAIRMGCALALAVGFASLVALAGGSGARAAVPSNGEAAVMPAVASDPFAASDAPRVLIVTASPRNAVEASVARRLESCLGDRLSRAGIDVVALDRAPSLERGREALVRAWLGAAAGDAGPAVERSRVADLLVELRVREVLRSVRQGRYVVEIAVAVDLIGAVDALRHASLDFTGSGRSLDGHPAASDRAVADLCGDDDGGMGAVLADRVRQVRDEELESGSLFTVGVRVRGPEGRAWLSRFEEALAGIEGLDTGSLVALAVGPEGGAMPREGAFAEYRLRFSGAVGDLRAALREVAPAPEPAFLTYRRRVDVVTWTRAPGPTLAEEVATCAGELLGELAADHRDGLRGRVVRVAPASVPRSPAAGGGPGGEATAAAVELRDRIDVGVLRAVAEVGAVSTWEPEAKATSEAAPGRSPQTSTEVVESAAASAAARAAASAAADTPAGVASSSPDCTLGVRLEPGAGGWTLTLDLADVRSGASKSASRSLPRAHAEELARIFGEGDAGAGAR